MFSVTASHLEQVLAQFDISLTSELVEELDSISSINLGHLVNDTRELTAGNIFCAVQGSQQDGSRYIDDAIKEGCQVIIAECSKAAQHGSITTQTVANKKIVQIAFYQLNKRLYALAKVYYCAPQNSLTMVGITGTNGKTSVSQMIAKLLNACKESCAVIGTNGAGNVENLTPIINTTPGATQLHQLLSTFKQQHYGHVAMEVSSHALAQGRVKCDLFNIAVFTNLTRDHLDYHQTMNNYADAKYQLFSGNAEQVAVVNADDEQAKIWLKEWPTEQPVMVYGRGDEISTYSSYAQASEIKHHQQGVTFTLTTIQGSIELSSKLIGDFNVDNLLAAISVLLVQGMTLKQISAAVKMLMPISGRMETFSAVNKQTAVVDYAHTPDALHNALAACRQHCQGDLWLVFGCGGDRDKGKRAQMGKIAEQLSDHVIITNDNPRSEIPTSIAQDILSGCQQPEKITLMLDRQKAVLMALSQAKTKDVVLLAGKGHEDYIVVGQQHIPYNERGLVRDTYLNYNQESSHADEEKS